MDQDHRLWHLEANGRELRNAVDRERDSAVHGTRTSRTAFRAQYYPPYWPWFGIHEPIRSRHVVSRRGRISNAHQAAGFSTVTPAHPIRPGLAALPQFPLTQQSVSSCGQNFILSTMLPSPESRLKAAQALSHEWVEKCKSPYLCSSLATPVRYCTPSRPCASCN